MSLQIRLYGEQGVMKIDVIQVVQDGRPVLDVSTTAMGQFVKVTADSLFQAGIGLKDQLGGGLGRWAWYDYELTGKSYAPLESEIFGFLSLVWERDARGYEGRALSDLFSEWERLLGETFGEGAKADFLDRLNKGVTPDEIYSGLVDEQTKRLSEVAKSKASIPGSPKLKK